MIELPEPGPLTVVVDTETSGLHWDPPVAARVSTVSAAWRDDDGAVVALAWPFDQGERDKIAGRPESLWDPNLGEDDWRCLLDWLSRRRLVFHNAKFDLHMLRVGTRHWTGLELEGSFVWDTMIAQRLLDPLEEVGLDASARRRLGLGKVGKDDLKDWLRKHRHKTWRYDLVPWEVMKPYATRDAEATLLLAEDGWARLDEGEGDRKLIDREMVTLLWLYHMERSGIAFDTAGSLEAAETCRRAQAEMGTRLPFSPPTDAAAKRYFFDQLGLPVEKRTGTGKPALDEEVCRRLAQDGHPGAEEWDEYKRLGRMVSNWFEGYPERMGPDGRLRTTFRQVKVVSGRFSVERVNLQAIPHVWKMQDGYPNVRDYFRAAPGCELWELDQSQAEIRVASSVRVAGCVPMLRDFAAGLDAHSAVAMQCFDVDPDHPEWTMYRTLAKRLSFCMLYGGGAATLQEQLWTMAGMRVDLAQCKTWMEQYRATYREFVIAARRYEEQAWRSGYITLISGRQRWFRPGEEKHKAFNQVVQGSSAEMVKDWGIAVDKAFPGMVLLTIHDSLWMEIPSADVEAVTADVRRLGEQTGENLFGLPFKVDAKRLDKEAV